MTFARIGRSMKNFEIARRGSSRAPVRPRRARRPSARASPCGPGRRAPDRRRRSGRRRPEPLVDDVSSPTCAPVSTRGVRRRRRRRPPARTRPAGRSRARRRDDERLACRPACGRARRGRAAPPLGVREDAADLQRPGGRRDAERREVELALVRDSRPRRAGRSGRDLPSSPAPPALAALSRCAAGRARRS